MLIVKLMHTLLLEVHFGTRSPAMLKRLLPIKSYFLIPNIRYSVSANFPLCKFITAAIKIMYQEALPFSSLFFELLALTINEDYVSKTPNW